MKLEQNIYPDISVLFIIFWCVLTQQFQLNPFKQQTIHLNVGI